MINKITDHEPIFFEPEEEAALRYFAEQVTVARNYHDLGSGRDCGFDKRVREQVEAKAGEYAAFDFCPIYWPCLSVSPPDMTVYEKPPGHQPDLIVNSDIKIGVKSVRPDGLPSMRSWVFAASDKLDCDLYLFAFVNSTRNPMSAWIAWMITPEDVRRLAEPLQKPDPTKFAVYHNDLLEAVGEKP